MRQAITTKFLGPTNNRGARVKATAARGLSLTVDWKYNMGVEGNHTEAAMALAVKLNWRGKWTGGGLDNDGYVFVNRVEGDDFEVTE